jgi:hypothetical protein
LEERPNSKTIEKRREAMRGEDMGRDILDLSLLRRASCLVSYPPSKEKPKRCVGTSS